MDPKIHPSFWNELYQRKLNIYKLNTDQQSITMNYKYNILDIDSFNNSIKGIPGSFINFNTIEDFNNYDNKKLLKSISTDILNTSISRPLNLFKFILLTFANLKSFKFTYKLYIPIFKEEYNLTKKNFDTYNLHKTIIQNKFDIYSNPLFIYNNYKILLFKEGWKEIQKKNVYIVLNGRSKRLYNLLAYLNKNNVKKSSIIILDGYAWTYKKLLTKIQFSNSNESKCYIYKTNEFIKSNFKYFFKSDTIDLSNILDKKTLMDQAINLNLDLMKWRSWPNLNLSLLSNKKCLLLGSGTLGCSVARNLMAWGFRNITFIDNGKVSLSNPVRQCLYEYNDCNKFKAECASNMLRRIYPGMNSSWYNLCIPMPGHPLNDNKDLNKLVDLINSHDICFLLTDTRESRWLPIVLANYYKKILINIALGFDSYLIDHNLKKNSACYFCNDIVAARNSMKNRTLDQQCSVTRPGLSMIASAIGTEILVSYLNGKEIPCHIRGTLSNFTSNNMITSKFRNCTACSDNIMSEYGKRGIDFIIEVCNDSTGKTLENLSGITQLMNEKLDIL